MKKRNAYCAEGKEKSNVNFKETNREIRTGVIRYCLKGEELELHPFGSIFWINKKCLLVSDTHFGKVSHFRKNGLAVPSAAIQQNWDRLTALIDHYKPEELIFLGDLFHSSHNNEWETFQMVSDTFHELKLMLIEGNHDILAPHLYSKANIEVQETLVRGPFIFSHHPLDSESFYNIHGHIHPAVRLKGSGRQNMKVPCFYFGQDYGIMPAFGNFTGTAIIPVREGDHVFAVTPSSVLKLS